MSFAVGAAGSAGFRGAEKRLVGDWCWEGFPGVETRRFLLAGSRCLTPASRDLVVMFRDAASRDSPLVATPSDALRLLSDECRPDAAVDA